MTPLESGSDRQFADDVLPTPVDKAAIPIPLDTVRPWHRPRKQFVRKHQWIQYSRDLIQKVRGTHALPVPSGSAPELRYLTLPGIDYLDVSLLADLCKEQSCDLVVTGFLSGSEGKGEIARAEVRQQSLMEARKISPNSHTFIRPFEQISSARNPAYLDLRRKSPFHIVNIDACGSIAAPSHRHAVRLVDAIYRVVELQLETQPGRWLLFLTTDARPDSVSTETMESLLSAIVENAEDNASFRTRTLDLFQGDATDFRDVLREASECAGERFLKLFSLGFSKWLLHLAREKQRDVKTHRAYCYSTAPKDHSIATMACLAFEFVPSDPGLQDPFGATRAEPKEGTLPEDTSIRAVKTAAEMVDLDQKMRIDTKLHARMIEETKTLLRNVGYSEELLNRLPS